MSSDAGLSEIEAGLEVLPDGDSLRSMRGQPYVTFSLIAPEHTDDDAMCEALIAALKVYKGRANGTTISWRERPNCEVGDGRKVIHTRLVIA